MRKNDFDVIDTLLHSLSESTLAVEANGDLTSCRDTTSNKECSCGGGGKSQPKPKPKPKAQKYANAGRALVKA